MHLPPPVHGAANVGKSIHDSKRINTLFDCHYVNLSIAASISDVGHFRLGKVLDFYRLLRLIRRKVKQVRPSLVYITPNAKGGAFFKEFVIVTMLKKMGCKVVAHYHNKGVSKKQDSWLYNAFYQHFFKDLRVILLSESLYSDVKKYIDRKDVYICPNGISPKGESKKRDKKSPNDEPRLLFLSNLIESKGVFVLLDALKILKDKGLLFTCDFVGGESKEIDAQLFNREISKRGLIEQVVYRGKKYGDEKYMVYQNADIFVFPTYYDNECFPLVLLEAMEQGLPCVTTNEGAISDIIKDGVNGLIAERNDVCSLAEKIEILFDDKELCLKMGEKGHQLFVDFFTLDVFESKMCEILEDLVR